MDDGDRLVGGKISSTRVFPFVVGWNQHGFPNQMSCSGSLITPTYFLSAAHCNNILFPSPKDKDKIDELRQKCVEATERNEDYKVLVAQSGETFEYHLKCRWLKKTEAFEIFSDPPGKAWLGVNNINQKRVNPIREEVAIKRHIRHLKTYTPSFDDIRGGQDDTKLAGYGRYQRNSGKTCETSRFGPMKFHYCDKTYGT